MADIDLKKSKEIENEIINDYGTEPLAVILDVTSSKSLSNLVKMVVRKYGKIDTLINNAIFEPRTQEFHNKFEDFRLGSWQKVLDVNLNGVFLSCKEVGKQMIKQKHGNIINISSIYGMVGADQRIYGKSKINSSVAYAVSKSAVINLSRYLASYWHNKNIRVNTLTLGGVFANQPKEFLKKYVSRTMLGRMAKQDEYNGAIIFLCSDASSYMTGTNLVIDGGWTAW